MKQELSVEELLLKNIELANRLEEAEQLIEAIKAGEVDAFALHKNNEAQIYTLQSGDYGYRMLVENFREGALTLSEDGLIVYTNSYFHELLSLSYDKIIGKSVFNFIHPDSKKTFDALFSRGLAGQSKGEIKLAAGNNVIPVYVSLTSLYPTLETVGMIVTDLTEKKKQEEIFQLQHKELIHNRNFIMNVLQSTNHGVISYVAIRKNNEIVDFEIKYANEPALEQLNMPAEKVIGNTYLTVIPLAKEYGLWDRIIRVFNTGNSETYEVNSPASPERSFLVKYTRSADGITCTFIETTQQKKREKQLEKMNKELESFAYISSHDLQEPLRKIQTFATRIIEKDHQTLSPRGIDMFQRMQQAANRMQILINDLLAYSRSNTSGGKFEETNLKTIIDEVIEDLKDDIREKNAIVEATELGHAHVIPFQFRQMMHNLISNALKFSKSGITPHIIIKSSIQQGADLNMKELFPFSRYCHISITDNGIGFEQQYSERIFQLFQRLHDRESYQGTGIGLSIVKKIVDNHNGFITAESELGKGSAFDIYIPANPPDGQATSNS